MKTTDIGNRGEDIASIFLKEHGYAILDRNWKQPSCEIDIIAKKQSVVYFVEVKYRKSDMYGSGYDYITKKKLKQMDFAARMWVAFHNYDGDMRLAAISINGETETVDFIDDL